MAADSKHISLSKRVHEVVILTVGALWKSPFGLYAHSAVAKNVGVPEAAIQALTRGESSAELWDEEQLAHRFSRELVSTHRVSDALYREAEKSFGRKALVDMVYLVVCTCLPVRS